MTTENNPAPASLNVSDELTEAARAGAAGTQPAFTNLTPKQQTKVIKALRKNKRERLDAILEQHALTLNAATIQEVLAEGTD